tara:strand:+ start:116 stop:391 length:276 start_codon:yes stop_codon:yes gene_type:complete
MPKRKIQKVRFHKGDKKPGGREVKDLSYSTKLIKRGRKMVWQLIEKPTNSIINEYFFEEDAQKIADFQNKNKVWKVNGGVPPFLCLKYNPK